MRRDFKLKNDMWVALHEWSYKVVTWFQTQFSEINVEGISKDVDYYYKVAVRSRVLEE